MLRQRPQASLRRSTHVPAISLWRNRVTAVVHAAKKRPQAGSGKQSSPPGQGFGPAAAKPDVKLSPALQAEVLDVLTPWETAAQPLWSTFCGHVEGEWLGQYGAYTPWAGEAEPVWADAQGNYLPYVFTRSVETRDAHHPQGDLLLRRVVRAVSAAEMAGRPLHAPLAAAESGEAPAAGSDRHDSDAASSDTTAAAAEGAAGTDGKSAADDGDDDDDLEGFGFNINGSVVFDGGSYSVGPEYIGVLSAEELEEATGSARASLERAFAASSSSSSSSSSSGGAEDEDFEDLVIEEVALREDEEDDAAAAAADGEGGGGASGGRVPSATVVMEAAIAWAGEARMRLKVTLKARQALGEELDVEVTRIVLFKEHWYGPPAAHPKVHRLLASHHFERPCIDLPRLSPRKLVGSWNAFTVAAAPVLETDALSGERLGVWVYSSKEERQAWSVPPPSDDVSDAGGTFYLPGGCIATFNMVPCASSSGSNNNSGNSSGSSSRRHRGFCLSFGWQVDPGTVMLVEREYDAAGQLAEVRQVTAVQGGWSGGRM